MHEEREVLSFPYTPRRLLLVLLIKVRLALISLCFLKYSVFCTLLLKVTRRCHNLDRPPLKGNTTASAQQIMDPETPAPTPPSQRPLAPLPESENVRSDESYENPDNLERSVTSIQWPLPYDEVRVQCSSSQPPAPPPARSRSTTAPVVHQPLSTPMSVLEERLESSGRRASSGHPQPLMPLTRRISAANNETSPSHAMAIMASTESQPPDVPRRKSTHLMSFHDHHEDHHHHLRKKDHRKSPNIFLLLVKTDCRNSLAHRMLLRKERANITIHLHHVKNQVV